MQVKTQLEANFCSSVKGGKFLCRPISHFPKTGWKFSDLPRAACCISYCKELKTYSGSQDQLQNSFIENTMFCSMKKYALNGASLLESAKR